MTDFRMLRSMSEVPAASRRLMWVITFILAATLSAFTPLYAQDEPHINPSKEPPLERFMKFAHPVGSFHLKFVGPNGGYMLAAVPVREAKTSHDTVVVERYFLIDLGIGSEGLYLAPDTIHSIVDKYAMVFPVTKDHVIHANLIASHSREELRQIEPNFRGVLGYGLLRQFVCVFDFKKELLTLYPAYSTVDVGIADPRTIQVPYLDDATLTYCHCPFPTVWMEGESAPLTPGHVQLALADPESMIFTPALTDELKEKVRQQSTPDSITHKKPKVGFNIAEFKIGGVNIARLNPRRQVADYPPAFRDLSVPVLGTLANDVLRKFSGLIFDPSRIQIIFVK